MIMAISELFWRRIYRVRVYAVTPEYSPERAQTRTTRRSEPRNYTTAKQMPRVPHGALSPPFKRFSIP